MQAVTKWHELKDTYSSFEIAEKKYDQIYPRLKFARKFLIDYGTFILENDPSMKPTKIEKAIKMLECAKQNLISREGMESLAYGYWVKKDYIQASKHFEWVSNFLPHLFAPKLALMKINLQKSNYKKAKELSIWIISTVPKINSREVEIIKSEAESLVKQFNLQQF